jgi:hypothetical protein
MINSTGAEEIVYVLKKIVISEDDAANGDAGNAVDGANATGADAAPGANVAPGGAPADVVAGASYASVVAGNGGARAEGNNEVPNVTAVEEDVDDILGGQGE